MLSDELEHLVPLRSLLGAVQPASAHDGGMPILAVLSVRRRAGSSFRARRTVGWEVPPHRGREGSGHALRALDVGLTIPAPGPAVPGRRSRSSSRFPGTASTTYSDSIAARLNPKQHRDSFHD